MISLSANVSDIFGHGQGASKLFDTISARLGQVFSGVGEFMEVFVLDKKRTKNESYRIRELGAAQSDAIALQWQAISPIINSGQQVREIGIVEGKIGAQLYGTPPELLALHQRSNNRIALENAMHQHNLEASVSYAAGELRNEQEVASEPVELGWVNQWSKFAQDASSEEMQSLWGRILAGEVKQPGSFSPRTLQFLSLLTQKEAMLFQRACSFNWYGVDNEISLILMPKNAADTMPAGFTYAELQLLSNIGLIELELIGGFALDTDKTELLYNGSAIEIALLESSYKKNIPAGQANLTQIGAELASICSPEYEAGIMDETVKYWVNNGCQVSSPYTKYIQPPKPTDLR